MSTTGSQGTYPNKLMPETVPGKWSVVSFGVVRLGARTLGSGRQLTKKVAKLLGLKVQWPFSH